MALLRASKKEGFSSRQWAVAHRLCHTTVQRTLARHGLVARVRPRKTLLRTASMVKRVAFAKRFKKRPKSWWRKVTFTDSKYFGITAAGRLFMWVKRGQKVPSRPRAPPEAPRVHVYAALNYTGVSPPVILKQKDMHVTASVYVARVLPALVKFSKERLGSGHIFMHDGATAHTARQTVHWMANCPELGDT